MSCESCTNQTLVTCMDPRVVPEQFLGPNARVAVFRNAGGRATPDVVRTINVVRTLSRKAPGFSVMVVHHTGKWSMSPNISERISDRYQCLDCGMTHLHDEEILEDARKVDPETTDTNFGCFAAEDLEKVILEDVETLKAAKSLKGVDIRGYVLVTETGRLHEL